MTKNPAAVKFRSPQKDLLDLNPTDGSNRICYSAPRMPLSKAFDLIRADADSKISVGLNSKDGADLGLIASLDSPHNPAKSIPNFSSAFDSVRASANPPPVPAAAKAPKCLTDAQKAALRAGTAAIEAAISEPDPVVALPQVPEQSMSMPPLPRMSNSPSEPLVVVSGLPATTVDVTSEPSVVLSTDAQVDVLLASVRYNPPRKAIGEYVSDVLTFFREIAQEVREAFKPNSEADEFGYVQKPNYVGIGLTAAFSSVVAVGALLIALNPFGVKETRSNMVASISAPAPISVSFENPQRNLVEPIISAPAPLEISRDVAVVTPTSVDMDFTTGEVSAPRRHHSRHHVLRSASTTTTPSTALVKVESLGSSPSVSVALSSKQFGRSRLFVGEVVGDSSVSTGTTVAGPRLIIDRTLSRMGLSMNDLPPQVASLISANTPKSLTNFAALVEAEAFRQVSSSLEEKEDIWMTRASLNADQLRQYARVLGATGLFN